MNTFELGKGPILSPQERLNYKKLFLMQLEDANTDIDLELDMLSQMERNLKQDISDVQAKNVIALMEVEREREMILQANRQMEALFQGKPEMVIEQFERRLDENFGNFSLMTERSEELDTMISIAKIQRTQKLEQACLLQSQLDSHQLHEQQLKSSIEQRTTEIKRIISANEKINAMQQQMFNLKKKLNNQLQEQKGNIRVYCRVRPRTTNNSVIAVTSDHTLKLLLSKTHVIDTGKDTVEHNYYFEHIFSEKDNQERVFIEISQLVQSSVDGKNVCIFAYGQTGSGKTYTLIGPQPQYNESTTDYNQRGLTSRSIEFIFAEIANSEAFKWKYSAFLSIQEHYLEDIIDLISNEKTSMDKIKEIEVFSIYSVETHLREAKANRKTAFTEMNESSSRSHLIVTLRLEGVNQNTGEVRKGSLVLVDLAGSERMKQSKVEGDAMKETQYINKTLSTLSTVINGIKRKMEYIPFRNSKLTYVLQPYLQGDSKTLMFVNISPDEVDASQTKISLAFAEGVRDCKGDKEKDNDNPVNRNNKNKKK